MSDRDRRSAIGSACSPAAALGQSVVQIATPTMAILIRPLPRLVTPSRPNRRLKPARSESLEKSGLSRRGGKDRAGLQHMAGERHRRSERRRSARASTPATSHNGASSSMMPRRIDAMLSGCSRKMRNIAQKPSAATCRTWRSARCRPAADEGRDFGGFDDVAVLVRLFQPSLCRLFCLLGFVLIVGHQPKCRHLRRVDS